MKYRSVHINKDGYYSLGVDEETGAYVFRKTALDAICKKIFPSATTG